MSDDNFALFAERIKKQGEPVERAWTRYKSTGEPPEVIKAALEMPPKPKPTPAVVTAHGFY